MNQELLVANETRVAELTEALNASTNQFQQLSANHNVLLGQLKEAQFSLDALKRLCAASCEDAPVQPCA